MGGLNHNEVTEKFSLLIFSTGNGGKDHEKISNIIVNANDNCKLVEHLLCRRDHL